MSGVSGAGGRSPIDHHVAPEVATDHTSGASGASSTAAPAQPSAPVGTFTLAGTDPVRGPFTGDVTFARGAGPRDVKVTYHAKFADGSEGTVTGQGTLLDGKKVLLDVSLAGAGKGAFAPASAAPGVSDPMFTLDYKFDPTMTSAAGYTSIEGRKLASGAPAGSTSEGVARPGPGLPAIPTGGPATPGAIVPSGVLSAASHAAGQYTSEASFGVSVPLSAIDGLHPPGSPDLTIQSPAGNTLSAFVTLRTGGSPQVQVNLSQPLIVKGPWYQPDVVIHTIWLDGDKVETDARFRSNTLASLPLIGGLPEKHADKAIANVTAGLAPLLELLHSKAQAGELADTDALSKAITEAQAQATGSASAGPLGPFAGKLDLAHGSVSASVRISSDIVEQQGNAKVTIAASTWISARAPMDLGTGRAGALSVSFDPPLKVEDTGHPLLSALAGARVNGLSVAPDGTVSIQSDASLGASIVKEDADQQAARATAIARVLMKQVPADSQLGQALRRAGVGTR